MAKSKLEKSVVETPSSSTGNSNYRAPHLLFGKLNYIVVAVGILFIIVGFALMSGGGSDDPNVFNAEAVYSARRITLAPIMVIAGFLINIYAIVKKP